jgi:hypothetical protein
MSACMTLSNIASDSTKFERLHRDRRRERWCGGPLPQHCQLAHSAPANTKQRDLIRAAGIEYVTRTIRNSRLAGTGPVPTAAFTGARTLRILPP